MSKSIVCLFSIVNDYDQPDNNLVAYWNSYPSEYELRKVLTDPEWDSRKFSDLQRGKEVRVDSTYYRLQGVEEGVLL